LEVLIQHPSNEGMVEKSPWRPLRFESILRMGDGRPELLFLFWGEFVVDGQSAEDVFIHCLLIRLTVVRRSRCRHPFFFFFFPVQEKLVPSRQ
jgi:hypothetical protein